MKKLMNLKGVKTLDRKQQKAINGGFGEPCCSGKPNGTKCRITCHPMCPRGVCVGGTCAAQ